MLSRCRKPYLNASRFVLFFLCVSTGLLAVPGSVLSREQIVFSVVTDKTPGLESSTIFMMEPDGTGQKRIFDFKWNMFDSTGHIFDIAVDSSGKKMFFSSDNAHMWTPLSRNIFAIRSDGSGFDQLTPLPESGNWNEVCRSCGIVEGYVRKSNGEPWGAAPVFLEGMSMTNAMPDGSFRFDHVPPGVHNIIAYKPGQAGTFTFMPVQVAEGTVNNVGALVLDSSGRLSMDRPDFYGGALYYRQSPGTVKKMDLKSGAVSNIYSIPVGGCDSMTTISGFDVSPVSGKIAIVDYATGCQGHEGVYVTDSDGRGAGLLASFKSEAWCGAGDAAWSPDEKYLAVTACYNWTYGLVILDVSTLRVVGMAWLPSQSGATFYNFHLHGWSPDGEWLLYSLWPKSPDDTTLVKIRVDSSSDNFLMPGNVAVEKQLCRGALDSAAWADIQKPDLPPGPELTVAVSGVSVRCAWSEVEGADGYRLYYAPYPSMSPIGDVDMKTRRGFTVELPHGSAYYVAVWPYNSRGDRFGVSNVAQFFVK
jgi:hypothetical protein